MITFEEAIAENQKFVIAPNCKTVVHGYFTNCRVNRDTVPDGWNVYDIRHGDTGRLCTIEPRVVVNHGGTFLTQGVVRMNKDGYYNLCGRGGYTFE